MIVFSDEDTPSDLSLAEKTRKTNTVAKNNGANDASQAVTWTSPNVFSPFTSSKKSSVQEQRNRESRARWREFAYGRALASDHVRNSPAKKEEQPSAQKVHLMDAFEEEMEASNVVALKPKVKRCPESCETVPVKHLLD